MKHKLLIIQESLDGGGAERVLIEYLNNIDYTSYEVSLVLVFGGGRYISEINSHVHCFEIFCRGLKPKMRIHEWLLFNKFILSYRANKILKGQSFDTILSFMEGPSFMVHQVLLGQGKKHVTWVHTNMITNPWSERLFRSHKREADAYKHMDCIAFVSVLAKDSFVSKFAEVSAQLIVINNPIDTMRIVKGSVEFKVPRDECFTVCSVGRMVEAKRFDRLIDAARILKEKGCKIKYWICGGGKLEEDLKKNITNYGLEQDFVLWGFKNNPYPYLTAADVFVLTSDTEGFPTVICEALTLGRPVISTDVPGTEELLGKSKYGLVCSKNAQSVADAILKFYNDAELVRQFSLLSLERSSYFNIAQTMDVFYKIINYGC